MFRAIGGLSIRYRWVTIAFWVALTAIGVAVMPSPGEFSMSTGFLAHGVESINARHLMNEKFPQDQGTASSAITVIYNPGGLTPTDEAYARQAAADVRSYDGSGNLVSVTSVFDQPALRPYLVSADNTTMLIPVGVGSEAFAAETGESVKAIRDNLPTPPPGTQVLVSGDAGLGGDHAQACLDALKATAIVTVALIAVVLLLAYRSPVAPLVPLLTIGVSTGVSLGLVGLLMAAGVEFSSFLEQFLILIVFGAGTDYCLFMVSRYREELGKGLGRQHAVLATMDRVGPVIASSAAVVIVGFLAMALARFEMLRTIGPGMALAVGVTLLAGVTLVPALMASVSPRVFFWPYGPTSSRDVEPHGAWKWLGRAVVRVPAGVLTAGLVLLLGPLAYLPSLNLTFEIDKELPASYESVRGYELISQRFDPSEALPVYVVAERNGTWRTPQGLAQLSALGERLSGTNGVKFVRSAVRPLGQPIPTDAALSSPELLALYVSAEGDTSRLMVGPSAGVFSNAAYDTVRDIRQQADAWASENNATVVVGGTSAEPVDLIDAINSDTPRIALLVTLGTFIVTALLLRSVVAPVFLLGSVFATVAATLAVTALVFQRVVDFRYDGVDWAVPLLLFVLVVVLASDYSIFLMSRVKEEAEQHGLIEGVERGVAHTGGVISAAGLILAGTFAALLLTPIGSLVQMGFAIAFGVLLDTFVVRPLVIPAIARMLGRWAWWPGPLSRKTATEQAQAVTGPLVR